MTDWLDFLKPCLFYFINMILAKISVKNDMLGFQKDTSSSKLLLKIVFFSFLVSLPGQFEEEKHKVIYLCILEPSL